MTLVLVDGERPEPLEILGDEVGGFDQSGVPEARAVAERVLGIAADAASGTPTPPDAGFSLLR